MLDFNKDWKFKLGNHMNEHLIDLDESEFVTKEIPHDFSIEQPYNEEKGDGCTAYLIGGIGWYRKHFSISQMDRGKKVFLYFDGIYNRANIYLNEKLISFEAYGYSPILLDVSNDVREENVLAVKVDRTRYCDSRWYAGAGIYRKVDLMILDTTYIPVYGVQVETAISSIESARLTIKTQVEQEDKAKEITLVQQIFDPNYRLVHKFENVLTVNESLVHTNEVIIEHPTLWDVFQGNLYTIETMILVNGEVRQSKITKTGIRFFEFTVDKGFFINGRHEYIKGVCLHHDAGLVGVAVPKDVWRRRFEILKSCGCNAIRTSHNPASTDFLDLCDEMGLLVQEEFYDEWDNPKDKRYNNGERFVDYISRGHHEFFRDYAKKNLQDTIRRDINHPSIVQWSIGNEIEWTYPKYNDATGYFGAQATGNYFFTLPPYSIEKIRENISKIPKDLYEIGDTAMKLSKWTKEMDTSRPVTANCILPSVSYETGYTDALDLVGFSYRRIVYDRCHEAYPDKPIMGTENLAQWHEWKAVLEHPFIAGVFLWTGIDYLGEVHNKGQWPIKANDAGLIDVGGFIKPSYHMFRTLWREEPYIHMVTQTVEKSLYDLEDGILVEKKKHNTWQAGTSWDTRRWVWQDVNDFYNYEKGDQLVVEVYSNCESVSLYQNDILISTQYLKDFEDHIYKWSIPYVAGKLVARAEGAEATLTTVGEPCIAKIQADKDTIKNEFDSIAHITVNLFDENGNEVRCKEGEVTFIFDNNTRVVGFDNGAKNFVGDHKCPVIRTNNGHALFIAGAKDKGEIKIKAKFLGQDTNEIFIKVV